MTDAEIDLHQTPRGAGEGLLALLAGALGLLFAVALFYPLMRGNLYLGSDLGAYHLPVRTFYSHCLKEGLSFLWWPDQFCGYYLHGEGQAGMFHPLHWLLYRFLPLDWAFNLEFVSGYFIAWCGMVRWEKRPLHAAAWTVHDDALPRARFVSESMVGEPAAMLGGQLDIARVAITDRPLALEAGEPGTVTWTRDEPGDVAFATRTATRQLLVFAERHHPGWRVAVDGADVPLERVYGDFMGCVVPAGDHDVTFYFSPTGLQVGGALSAAGLLALAVGWLAIGRTRRFGLARQNHSSRS